MQSEHKNVVSSMAEKCRDIRVTGLPLIMIDTFDKELAWEVALESDIVTTIRAESRKKFSSDDYYFDFLLEGYNGIQNYENFFDQWTSLIKNQEGKPFHIKNMNPGMYVLPLNKDSWQKNSDQENSRIKRLREYVGSYVKSVDPNSPVRRSCIILYGDPQYIPEDLMEYTMIVEEEFPQKKEIWKIISKMVEEAGVSLSEEVIRELVNDLSGFSIGNVRRRLTSLLRAEEIEGGPAILDPKFRKKTILSAKKQVLIENGGILELQILSDEEKAHQLAGMKNYQDWIKERTTFMKHAEEMKLKLGIMPPKGVLLCGVPGCGKSEAAKMLQIQWDGIPLLRMNIDAMMGGVVGESEKNLRKALKQAEAMAPCILWIDEIEKGLSGASSKSGSDSGTFKRMFGRLLGWMQDNKKSCFIFATANDISQLPVEFFRKGRFDELFGVYMPTSEECKNIFLEQMSRAEKMRKAQAKELGMESNLDLFEKSYTDKENEKIINGVFDPVMNELAQQKMFVSGADIAEIVKRTLMDLETMKQKPKMPISGTDWQTMLINTIRSGIMTQGCGYANLNSIAACYLQLLRKNFVPAGKDALFHSKDYSVDWDPQKGQIVASYEGTVPNDPYDQALYLAIKERIDRFATAMEQKEQAALF
ncbi:MAG: AAA family ATPase [Firmicutes bacterium]|nr:AAA family ATPase [Bacillota bacterium]